MQRDMGALLTDSNGLLKPFKQWANDVLPIASHQCGAWLRTEYDTAVLRAHQAADWHQFVREADVLPNLKWMPSTSPNPGPTIRSSGTPSGLSTIHSGASIGRATVGTASALSQAPTSRVPLRLTPTRLPSRSRDCPLIREQTVPSSRKTTPIFQSRAHRAVSINRTSRTGCAISSRRGQRTATTVRTSMDAYLVRKK